MSVPALFPRLRRNPAIDGSPAVTWPLLLLAAALGVVAAGCAEPEPPPPLHPAFSINMPDLEEVLEAMDAAAAQQVRARPQVFLELMQQMLAAPQPLYRLVDKQHALESDYAPGDLVALERYQIATNRAGHRLSRLVMPDLLAMVESARGDGIELLVSSAYRSYRYQAGLYDRHVEQLGQAAADRVSARPGHSQHQLGTTVDFGSIAAGYGDTPNGRWLAASAWRFGFSLSYPAGYEEYTGYDYEPWHFRYLGRVGTLLERQFFGGLQQRFLEFFAEWAWWFELRQLAA